VKRALVGLGGLLALLVIVLLVRGATLSSLQPQVDPLPPVAVDEEGVVARLSEAVRIATISPQDPADRDSAAFLAFHALLEERWPRVHQRLARETVNGLSLLYTWEGRDSSLEPVVLMAHQDVVPVEPERVAAWSHPPFQGEVAQGYVWGRGTMDDKASLVAILEAVEMLLAEGFQPRRTVYLVFGHDEEVGGDRGAAAMAALLEERGVEEYALVLDEGGAVVRDMIPGMAGAAALVGIAEKGYVNVELLVDREGGHSSSPPASTAIGILSRAVTRLEEDPFPARLDGPSREMFRWLAPEMPLPARTAFANLWLSGPLLRRALLAEDASAAMLRTTTAVTVVEGGGKANVLPTRARAVVNHRIRPGETMESVLERDRRVVADPRVGVRLNDLLGDEPSPVSDVEGPAFVELATTIREVLADENVVVAPYLVIGGTDAKHFARASSNVFRFLPAPVGDGDLQRMHGLDERLPVTALFTSVRFYHRLLQRFAGS